MNACGSTAGPPRYPWAGWLARKKFTLTHGLDYTGLPHAMAQQVRNAAARLNYRVSIRVGADGTIRVTSRPARLD